MNYDMTVEQLKEKHDKEMRELTTAQIIGSSLPSPPKRVMFGLAPQPWIIYSRPTLAEAVALAEAFRDKWHWYVYAREQGGCTHIQPTGALPKRHAPWASFLELEGAPFLGLQSVEHCPSSAELVFYAKVVTEQVARVIIDIEQAPARIDVKVLHEGVGRWGNVVTKKTYPNLHEDKIVKWGDESDISGKASYLWMANSAYKAAMDSLIPNTVGRIISEKV